MALATGGHMPARIKTNESFENKESFDIDEVV